MRLRAETKSELQSVRFVCRLVKDKAWKTIGLELVIVTGNATVKVNMAA